MRHLAKYAIRLYPAAWRARYGCEVEALMEDTGVRAGDIWDLARGAIFMQMTSLSFPKIVAGFTLAGLLASGVWAAMQQPEYVSTAVMRLRPVTAADPAASKMAMQIRLQRLQQDALSRHSLIDVIQSRNLFRKERQQQPLEDIIEQMRSRNIRLQVVDSPGAATFSVQYTSADPAEAQAAAQAIVAALIEQNVAKPPAPGEPANLEVIDPASLPAQPSGPSRPAVIARGGGMGLIVGITCGAVWWLLRRGKRISLWRVGVFAAAGMAIGVAIAYAIPNQYISTAVLRSADRSSLQPTIARVLSDDSVAALIRRHGLFASDVSRDGIAAVARKVRAERIQARTVNLPMGEIYVVSFRYPDRAAAQSVTQDLVAQFIGQPNTEVINAASKPVLPSSPNRLTIALLGVLLGTVLGVASGYFRPEKLATA
jgi:hypothetical protein